MNPANKIFWGLALFATSAIATAQEWPSRPVRLIVPVSPGGATDAIVRMMAPKMSATLGTSVAVENLAGAGGIVGTVAAKKAAPDGYTWLISSTGAFTANPHLHKQLPYATADFDPVCRIGTGPYVLVVNPSLGIKTLSELLARAKAGSLSFASPGLGSAAHMAQELFKSRAAPGVPFVHVPYKGTAQAINDTIGGHSQVLFEAPGPLIPQIESGKLVALGVTSARRLSSLPQVPTFAELGHPEVRLEGWIGLSVPHSTPAPIVTKIVSACKSALADPELQERAQALSFQIEFLAPPDFKAFMANELQKWGELTRQAGLKPE